MRFVLILACLAWLYVAHTQGQQACRGHVLNVWLTCEGEKSEGKSLMPHCWRNSNPNMWYYDQRRGTCRHQVYHGCGGNTIGTAVSRNVSGTVNDEHSTSSLIKNMKVLINDMEHDC